MIGLLLSARDVKTAVPCSLLSKASAAGSRVQVTPVRRSGLRDLAIDCGRWRGAPTAAVHMDYRQVGRLQQRCPGGGKGSGGGARWVLSLDHLTPLFCSSLQLLQHASDDAVRSLHKKLAVRKLAAAV